MLVYAQTEYKGTWHPVECKPDFSIDSLAAAGYVRATILKLNKPVDSGETGAKYRGPFYMDIDAKDIEDSIFAAKRLYRHLSDKGVPDSIMQWSLSGTKGFHLIVDEKCFSSGRARADLPAVYAEMARQIAVLGVDFGVYNGGKGTCWRLHNVQREDGRYRVRATAEEIMSMTSDIYTRLTSSPRTIAADDSTQHDPYLAEMFDLAKRTASAAPRVSALVIDDKKLISEFKDEMPECVNLLVQGERTNSSSFNDVSLQLGIYFARSGLSDDLTKQAITRAASSLDSDTYSSPRARQMHIESSITFAEKRGSKYKFSCPAMRKVVRGNPCRDCVLATHTSKTKINHEDLLDRHSLKVDDAGIWTVNGGVPRPLATFNITPVTIYRTEKGSREGVKMILSTESGEHKETVFREGDWDSREGILQHVHGLNGASYLGGSQGVQAIKHAVLNSPDIADADTVTIVNAVGMYIDTASTPQVMTYVEPNYSINKFGVADTYILDPEVAIPGPNTNIRLTPNPKRGDRQTSEALMALLTMNSRENIGAIFGWMCACTLKAHIMTSFGAFPSLGVWGAADSGKSVTTRAMGAIAGTDFRKTPPLSASNTTAWPILDLLRSSRTVPRIIEELNLTGNRIPKARAATFTEAIKSVWDGTAIARGTIAKAGSDGIAAGTKMVTMTAPVCFVAEQEISMPAIRQRSIQVHLTKASRAGKEEQQIKAYLDPEARNKILSFSKAMINYALTTSIDEVVEMVTDNSKLISGGIQDRAKHSYACILTGLQFFEKVAEKMQVSDAVIREIREIYNATATSVAVAGNEIAMQKVVTEVDAMLDKVFMWYAYQMTNPNTRLVATKFVNIGPDIVLINLPAVLYAVIKDSNSHAANLAIRDGSTAKALIKSEDYYIGEGPAGPAWVALSVPLLIARGHDILAEAAGVSPVVGGGVLNTPTQPQMTAH